MNESRNGINDPIINLSTLKYYSISLTIRTINLNIRVDSKNLIHKAMFFLIIKKGDY